MNNWRALADEALTACESENTRDTRDKSPPSVPNVPSVPDDPKRLMRLWRSGLAALDRGQPRGGIDPTRWRRLIDDADYFMEGFADQAARCGWATGDIFGLWAGKPGWGGVVDRLHGSRSLVMGGNVASWRNGSVPDRYLRGAYPDLLPMWATGAGQ